MRQARASFEIETSGQRLYEITDRLRHWVEGQEIRDGLLTVYIHHTSASLVIQENIDDDVLRDIEDWFRRAVPEDTRIYRHNAEGPDDMPAHIRAAVTATQLAVPVDGGRLDLGRYQGVFLFEHREQPKSRRLTFHLLGE